MSFVVLVPQTNYVIFAVTSTKNKALRSLDESIPIFKSLKALFTIIKSTLNEWFGHCVENIQKWSAYLWFIWPRPKRDYCAKEKKTKPATNSFENKLVLLFMAWDSVLPRCMCFVFRSFYVIISQRTLYQRVYVLISKYR